MTQHDRIRRMSQKVILPKMGVFVKVSFLGQISFFTYLDSLISYVPHPKIWTKNINSKYLKSLFILSKAHRLAFGFLKYETVPVSFCTRNCCCYASRNITSYQNWRCCSLSLVICRQTSCKWSFTVDVMLKSLYVYEKKTPLVLVQITLTLWKSKIGPKIYISEDDFVNVGLKQNIIILLSLVLSSLSLSLFLLPSHYNFLLFIPFPSITLVYFLSSISSYFHVVFLHISLTVQFPLSLKTVALYT